MTFLDNFGVFKYTSPLGPLGHGKRWEKLRLGAGGLSEASPSRARQARGRPTGPTRPNPTPPKKGNTCMKMP